MSRPDGNRGGGRRTLGTDAQRGATVRRTIRIPDADWDLLTFAARAAGVTVAEYIRRAVALKIAIDKGRDGAMTDAKPRKSITYDRHDFVRRDNPDGEHRDRICVVCGFSDDNPLHR